LDRRQCHIGGQLLREGDFLSLDGNTGAVYPGRLLALKDYPAAALATIAHWKSIAVENDVASRTHERTATS